MATRKQTKPKPAPKGRVMKFGGGSAPAAPPVPPSSKVDLLDFFRNVGTGFVDAQTALDQKSKEYLDSIQGKSYIPPSVFRIPKVTASVKVAMDVKEDSKVNLLFYTDEKVAQTLSQQTVEFDIVAAPAPPGYASALPFAVSVVADPATRGRIFATLAHIARADSPLLSAPGRIVVIASDAGFYLLYGETRPQAKLGAWFFVPGDEPALAPIREFGPAGDALAVLCGMLSKQADAQEKFLAALG